MSEVPLLDLAPKLKRPLSLWNPLDYLLLLYWVFYFPQAIRWYVKNFCEPVPETNTLNLQEQGGLEQQSSRKFQLVLMGLFLAMIVPDLICFSLQSIGFRIVWELMLFGSTVLSIVLCVSSNEVKGLAGYLACGVAGCVIGGVTIGMASSLSGNPIVVPVNWSGALSDIWCGF